MCIRDSFEPLTPEDVEAVVELEKPWGAVVQFGGQTAIKLAKALTDMGVPILGTSSDGVDAAEDRERFDEILQPVSYTHLDVYKRQALERAWSEANSSENPGEVVSSNTSSVFGD